MTTLTGKKVILRPYQSEDAQILLGATIDPVVTRLTGTHNTFTLDQIERYIANSLSADDRAGFMITDAISGRAVGEIVLMDIDDANRSAGLRIALFYEADFSKGYGTEALHLLVGYGFGTLKLHRIALEVFDFNQRAIHVYEKIGFRREGILRDSLLWEGEYHSAILMAMLESDWQ